MSCLSREKLARVAVEPETDSGAAAHLDACSGCRERLDEARSTVAKLSELHREFDQGHEQARAQLMGALSALCEPGRASQWNRLAWRFARFTVSRHVAVASLALAAMLVAGLFWYGGMVRPVSAKERMARSFRNAKSVDADLLIEGVVWLDPEKSSQIHGRLKYSWRAPNVCRYQSTGGSSESIFSAHRIDLTISHTERTFSYTRPRSGSITPLVMLDKLASFSADADRDLGRKMIAGHIAEGFQVDAAKIDATLTPGPMHVWIDQTSNLPVLVRYEIVGPCGKIVVLFENFRWDAVGDADPIETKPPVGYTEKKYDPPPLSERLPTIVEAFKEYAKLNSGHYPRVEAIYSGPVMHEAYKLAGVKSLTWDLYRNGTMAMLDAIAVGIGHSEDIGLNNPDSAYNGKTVGPKDSGKVLLRWLLEDGQYQVIYGDLRHEIVSAERLRQLGGK